MSTNEDWIVPQEDIDLMFCDGKIISVSIRGQSVKRLSLELHSTPHDTSSPFAQLIRDNNDQEKGDRP